MPPTTRQSSSSKIQAKLDFSPLSKDSAQAQQLSTSVRHRASAVVFCSPKKAKTASTNPSPATNGTKPKSKDTKAKQQELQLGRRSSRANAKLPRIDGLSSTDDFIYGSQRKSSPGGKLHSDLRSSQLVSGGRRNAGREVFRSSPPIGGSSDQDDDEDEDEDELLLPVGTRSRPQIVDDDGEEDDLDVNMALPRNSRSECALDGEGHLVLPDARIQGQARTRQMIDDDEFAEESTNIGSEDEPVLLSSTRLQRRSNVLSLESDEEDELASSIRAPKRLHSRSDQAQTSSSPTKKRRLQQGSKPRRMTREEQDEEVLEDAQDLQDTVTIDQDLRSTSKLNEKKLARQRQLSKLAARRSKTTSTAIQISSSSPEPEDLPLHRPYNDTYSDDNSSQADSLIDDSDPEAASPTSSTSEIRINRTIYSIPSALYYAIQQLLHTKFSPKPHTNAYYTAANSLLSKRLESYANQYISSIWRKDFTAALYARPRLTWPRNELSLWESCEACGRRDHPARYVIRFEGPCYNEHTLQNLDNDKNSSVFQKFDTQVPEDAVWHVGADCHDNAWRAHRAVHWRMGLRGQIERVLTMMGVDVDDELDERSEERSEEPEETTQERKNSQPIINTQNEPEDEQDNIATAALGLEDRFQAILLQMEDQGYMQALQKEFLERFGMEDDEEDD